MADANRFRVPAGFVFFVGRCAACGRPVKVAVAEEDIVAVRVRREVQTAGGVESVLRVYCPFCTLVSEAPETVEEE